MTGPADEAEEARAAQVVARLEEVRQLLELVAAGITGEVVEPQWRSRIDDLVTGAIDEAARVRRLRELEALAIEERAIELLDAARRALRTNRERDRLTQRDLAETMRTRGFAWQRITVAEVESGRRRPTLEELLGLADVFDTSLVALLGSFEDAEACRLNETSVITVEEARRLLSGPGDGW